MAFVLFSFTAQSQNTFDYIYSVLQSNCATTCHNYGSPDGNLRFDIPKEDLISDLVNVIPDNAAASAAGIKRVFPGDARRSLLFRKVNHGLDANLVLTQDEGDPMPLYASPLSELDREMIRQWIIFGAEDTLYAYADTQVIRSFYDGFAEPRPIPIPIPDPSEGYQLYYGPIFLTPNDEVEFDSKFPMFNPDDVEVHKMRVDMNNESHHLAIYKYHPGKDTTNTPGLNQVNSIIDAADLFFIADVVAQWPNSLEIELPEGTALMWEANTVLNMSYHILNMKSKIMAAEVYMNIYTRPQQPETLPMESYPVRYDGHQRYQGGWDVFNLILYPTGEDTTLVINQWDTDSTFYWNIWSMQAHQHQIGTDFNVFLRNPDGTKGEHVYIGKSNADHTVQTGFYDWEHPPLRYFNPLLPVDMTLGLIHEATFNNNTGDTVGFGLKTTDEMFVTYIFFVKTEQPLGILPGKVFNEAHVKIYPNPSNHTAFIHIGPDVLLKNADFRIFNLMGQEVMSVHDLKDRRLSLNVAVLSPGTYFYRLVNDGSVAAAGKILVQH